MHVSRKPKVCLFGRLRYMGILKHLLEQSIDRVISNRTDITILDSSNAWMALDYIQRVKWTVDVSPIPCPRLAWFCHYGMRHCKRNEKQNWNLEIRGKTGSFGRTMYTDAEGTCYHMHVTWSFPWAGVVSCSWFFLPKVSFNSIARTPRVWETIRNRPRLKEVL